jgi:hypothetical protein
MPVGGDVRAVRGAVLFGVGLIVISELLGAFEAFARGPVAAVWSLAAVGAGLAWSRRRRRGSGAPEPGRARDPAAVVALAAVGIVLALCLAAALVAPLSNGDVLGYHLPRVRHWIQNRGFAHYPTASLRQISFPMGGGYLVAHLVLLTGSDRLASLPQWGALLGCALITASLGRRLAGPGARIPTALACVTVPMAVLQATNPQTDLIAAFSLACFVHLVFATPRYRPVDVLWLGLALGVGLATKPTLELFAAPFLVILALRARRYGRLAAVAVPLVTVLVAVGPALPNAIRNVRTFGDPLGTDVGAALGRRDARVVASNVLRVAALSYPARAVWRGVTWIHAHLLHLDASDPATTFPETGFDERFVEPLRSPDENFAASPLHVTLALASAAAALRRWPRRGRAALRAQLVLALGAAFLLYCAGLRWQPWANRLLLPLVLLGSPLIGWALAEIARPVRLAMGALLGVMAIVCTLTSVRHRLLPPSILSLPRTEAVFADYDRDLPAEYEALLHRAAHDRCARIGLVSTEFAPEYLLWTTLDRTGLPVAIGAANVDNPSRGARPEQAALAPCARITLRRDGGARYTATP